LKQIETALNDALQTWRETRSGTIVDAYIVALPRNTMDVRLSYDSWSKLDRTERKAYPLRDAILDHICGSPGLFPAVVAASSRRKARDMIVTIREHLYA